MGQPFFSSPDRVALLQAAVEKWLGRPFAQHRCDCVILIRELLRESGFDVSEAEDIPKYSVNWGRFQEQSLILLWFDRLARSTGKVARVDHDEVPQVGDIVLWREHVSCHHIGILYEPWNLAHCALEYGVVWTPLASAREQRTIVGLRRPLET